MNAQPQPTKTVLIVDDDQEFREALVEIVRDQGFEVETATSGMQALDKLRWGLRPCVVLLDMQMAVMTGWDFRSEQTRDATLAKIPVIAMTAGYWNCSHVPIAVARARSMPVLGAAKPSSADTNVL